MVAKAAPVPSAGVFDSPGVQICLNTEWVSHLDGLIGALLERTAWVGTETEIDTAIQEVHKLLVKFCDVGDCQVVMVQVGDIKQGVQYGDHNGWLKCDGRQLATPDYADLATALGAGGWNVDEDFFNLPNFVGRVAVGAGVSPQAPASPRAQGVYFGADTHTLTEQQIPAHQHGQRTRNNEAANAFTVTGGANLFPSSGFTTGTNRLATDPAGGGQAHNNLQPSLTVNFFIYAGA